MDFKKKFKFSIRKLSIGVVSLSLGITTLAQPIALLGQSNVAHAEEATPAAEKKAGKVTIERVDLDAKPEIQAGEEFEIKIKWVADPGQTSLGGLNSELNFDINTMEYVKVKTNTPNGMGNSYINATAVKTGKSRFGSTSVGNTELEVVFTFKAKRNITSADNYNFVFKAFPAPDGRVRWYTNPDYSGPTPLISSWEGLDADGTISVKLAKEAEATYNATYEFESATAGKDLPQEVKDLLPTDNTKYKKDDQVAAKQPTSTEVADAAQDGKWVFKGYEPAGPVTVADKDVKFVGKWEFKANEHNVSYEFTSGTAGKELPQAVKDLLPTDAAKYVKGAQVNAVQPAQAEVEDAAQDGKWEFKGYEPASPVTVGTEDVKFVGKWEFKANEHNVSYEFVSGTAGKDLPQAVKDLLPTDANKYKKDQQVTATQPAQTEVEVAAEDGKWVFKGYEPASPVTVGTEDVKFVGKWEFEAKEHNATYKFESATAGKELPQEVKDLLPTDAAKYKKGEQVNAKQPGQTQVTVADGKWEFKGYEPAGPVTMGDKDVEFVGKWEYKANPVAKYTVGYKFESETAGKELPQEVKDLLPTDANEYENGAQVDAKQPAKAEVEVADGKWVFKGYAANQQTVNGSNVEFVGKWAFEAKQVTKYTVGYKFESETAGKELPQEVKDLLPTDADEYVNGDTVNAKQPAKAEVEVADGKWVFKGYAANSQTVNGSNVEFVGKWAFEAKQVTKYTVDYAFASSTAGKQLPGEVLALIPTDSKEYTNGEEVIAKDPAKTEVEVADGKWTFDGYQQNKFTVNNANVTFQGTWTFTAKPKPPVTKYKATYEFTSTDATKALPAEVLALLPTDADEYVNGATVNAKQPAKTEVTVADGKWTFNGYGANTQTVNGSDVKFSGTWTFTANATPPANKYKATYEFKSADATKALPNGVLRLLPNDTKEYANGDKAKAIQPAVTSVVTPTGTWTFAGYDATEKPINGAGVKFTGTWTFTASQTPPQVEEKKGSVIVRYVSTDNKKLKDDYIDTKDAVVGTPYNAAENETERPTVIVKDGEKYELVEIKGNPRGKVVEGTTVVTYVYKKVAKQPQPGHQDWDPFKPGEQKPTKPGKGKLANTGQTTTNAGIAGVALAGLALAAMRRRKNK